MPTQDQNPTVPPSAATAEPWSIVIVSIDFPLEMIALAGAFPFFRQNFSKVAAAYILEPAAFGISEYGLQAAFVVRTAERCLSSAH